MRARVPDVTTSQRLMFWQVKSPAQQVTVLESLERKTDFKVFFLLSFLSSHIQKVLSCNGLEQLFEPTGV